MLTDVYETRKNNILLMMKQFPTRKDFVSKIDIDYNLFNQYIGPKSKKNIGDKLALKITESFHLPKGWLDHPQDAATIKSIINSQESFEFSLSDTNQKVELNHTSNLSNNQFRMFALRNILKISKGEDLEVTTDLEEKRAVEVPQSIKNPMTYLIKGTVIRSHTETVMLLFVNISANQLPVKMSLYFAKMEKFSLESFYTNKIF